MEAVITIPRTAQNAPHVMEQGMEYKMSVDDDATLREEQDRAIALKFRKPQLALTGYCWNCGEACKGVYCCSECREDSEQRERFNR